MTASQSIHPLPSIKIALLTLLGIIATITIGLAFLGVSLHILLLLCLCIAGISAYSISKDFSAVKNAMNSGITRSLSALYIFILIGVLIASFIQSGTIATLIVYGLQSLTPSLFLPIGLLLCSFMSIATGTSWGTVGTLGLALMTIGGTMGIPLPIIAGMVISGACFGDKMSPASDTTVLASMSSEVPLYTHIKSMMVTTIPTYIIVLIIFSIIGTQYATSFNNSTALDIINTLNSVTNISPLTLVPLLVMVGLSIKKVPAEISMLTSSIIGVIIAITLQDKAFIHVLNSLFSGDSSVKTPIESINSLLSRGGIMSMMWTFSLAFIALALGGILNSYNLISVLILKVLEKLKSLTSIVATTIATSIFGNALFGEAYITLILNGQLFKDTYDKNGIKRSILSRSCEEGATFSAPLIPWTTAGAFFSASLGISALEYIPWALLNWMNAIVAITFAFFGIGAFYAKKSQNAKS